MIAGLLKAGELAHQQTEKIAAWLGLDGDALHVVLVFFIVATRLSHVLADYRLDAGGEH